MDRHEIARHPFVGDRHRSTRCDLLPKQWDDRSVRPKDVAEALDLAPGTEMGEFADDPERSERVVAVKWLKTVSRDQAIWEKGMFANQNTACALRSSFTRERVLEALGLSE